MTQKASTPWPYSLDLRPGETVVVRSKEEILSTLDRHGRLDGMPFMPEMLQYCGQRLEVESRAVKSCDTIVSGDGRQVWDSVHLAGVRCDGGHHGGCQARCLIWWREAWLKRVDDPSPHLPDTVPSCTEQTLFRETTVRNLTPTIYSCQATNMRDFTFGMRWYDPRPLARELRSGNQRLTEALGVMLHAAANIIRRKLGRPSQPNVRGRSRSGTLSGRIPDLKPGDWVRVKSKEAIEETLDGRQKNRGLLFDVEMLPYCGRELRVLDRVEKIIDERKGAMRTLPNDCWILEGAACSGRLSRARLFCTRRIYPYWREIWLEKIDASGASVRGPGEGGAG